MRAMIAGIVGLALAAIVVLIVAGGSIVGKGIALALFGIACVVASRAVFLAVGRSEDAERAAAAAPPPPPSPSPSRRGRAARGSASAAGAGPPAAYAAASAQLAAVTRLMSKSIVTPGVWPGTPPTKWSGTPVCALTTYVSV